MTARSGARNKLRVEVRRVAFLAEAFLRRAGAQSLVTVYRCSCRNFNVRFRSRRYVSRYFSTDGVQMPEFRSSIVGEKTYGL